MNEFERAAALLPEKYRQAVAPYRQRAVEEIRLRIGRPPCVLINGREAAFSEEKVTPEDLHCVLERATGASLHTAIASMRDGYLDCRGLRIGLCGEAVIREERPVSFRSFGSLAIRIPRERRGICDAFIDALYGERYRSSLIIAPPGAGKTTVLRELIRCLSERGERVAVVDERNELSATESGIAFYDLGMHSDVLLRTPKAVGALMLLRAMNPTIIAMDEITRREDVEAIHELAGSGVGILASVHGAGPDELRKKERCRGLLDAGIFERLILIHNDRGRRSYRVMETGP